jgi:hypothetical protein
VLDIKCILLFDVGSAMDGADTSDDLSENKLTKAMPLRAGTCCCSQIGRWVAWLTSPIATDVAIIHPIRSLPSLITLTKCPGWICSLEGRNKDCRIREIRLCKQP